MGWGEGKRGLRKVGSMIVHIFSSDDEDFQIDLQIHYQVIGSSSLNQCSGVVVWFGFSLSLSLLPQLKNRRVNSGYL
jgi:hypothetical protein